MGGLWVTIQLSGFAIIVGTIIGFGLGLVMRIRIPLLRWPLIAVVDVVRSIPPFALLLIANYLLPELLQLPNLTPFAIASIVLILNLSCFVGDVVRGGFAHVPQGEIDAARAVGLTDVRVFT